MRFLVLGQPLDGPNGWLLLVTNFYYVLSIVAVHVLT